MKGLFIHDHKFPNDGKTYYHSYGFDNEFFNRYLTVFDKFNIIARKTKIPSDQIKITPSIDENIEFVTINGYGELKNKFIRKKIDNQIKDSDYLIIRLPSILGIYAIRKAVKLKKPYLIELVGCPWDAYWNQKISKKVFAPFITLLTRKGVRNANYVVYVTEKYLQNKYPTFGKSISCSNVTLPSVDESSLRNRLAKIENINSNQRIVIGTCATVDALYKGQKYVIQTIARLNSQGYKIEYQLVGGGNSGYLKNIAKKNGIESDVKFLGKLKHEDVFAWLDNIDIYVQPSLTEGLPRSVIEAMSRGCPVLGSDAGGIPELIDKDFIFRKGNVTSIYETFKRFSSDSMRDQALINHKNSKRYLKSILYKRRIEFLEDFTRGDS
jgi:glycosyltransferase involved in cell wall biosynthesis